MTKRETGFVHDLAPLKLASSAALDWETAAIPGRHLTGQMILHVKTVLDRASQLEATLGLAGAGRIAMIGPVECFWMGPGEWLLLAPTEHREQLAALELHALANGAATAPTDDRLVVLELNTVAELLSGLTGLPDEMLRPGRVARTRLADIPVTIVAGLSTRFRLLFDRTCAPHMRAWLDRAI